MINSTASQEKNMIVEIDIIYGQKNKIIHIPVKAETSIHGMELALRVVRRTYGREAEFYCQIKGVEFLA